MNMKAFLLYRDRDFDPEEPLPANEAALIQDLELTILFDAMAGDDRFIRDVVTRIVLTGLRDSETILYRQAHIARLLAKRTGRQGHPRSHDRVHGTTATQLLEFHQPLTRIDPLQCNQLVAVVGRVPETVAAHRRPARWRLSIRSLHGPVFHAPARAR